MALFGRHITKEVVTDLDKLTEEVYIFLNVFVPNKIRYESKEEKEDCIQDTALHILKRFEELEVEELEEDFNYEKFLYNRANSYVSYWLRRLVKERQNMKEYMEYLYYFYKGFEEEKANQIDHKVLQEVILEYNLGGRENQTLFAICINKLIGMGFAGTEKEVKSLGKINKSLDSLSYAVVDEYLFKVYGGEESEE